MRTRTFKLTEPEVAALKQAEQQAKRPNELRRMQAVRLFGTGMDKHQIVEITGFSERNLQRLASCFRQDGVAALFERRRGGNNTRLSREQRAELAERLQQYRPVDLHISQAVYWTVSDLKVAVARWYRVVYQSPYSYYTLMHQSRLSLQRPTTLYRSRPSAEAVAEFEATLQKK